MFKKLIEWLWTGLLCLRTGKSGGLDCCGSGRGRVVNWIAVAQDGEEWWTGLLWLRTGKSGELDCCGSGRGRVVNWIAVAQDGEEWWT